MRIINGMLFLIMGMLLFVSCYRKKRGGKKGSNFWNYIEKYRAIVGVLFAANLISFALTYSPELSQIYIEKGKYGEEERVIPFVLQKGEDTTEISLVVSARQFTKEELKEKIKEAFGILDDELRGDNVSLSEIQTDLNCSLDKEQYPFDVELISEDYAVVDGDGHVHNSERELLTLGYTKDDVAAGIPLNITVVLWYGEERFEKVYPLIIKKRKMDNLEKIFAGVEKVLQEEEQKALYQEGFSIPVLIDEVSVSRSDEGRITPLQVLFGGCVLAFLLVLRERENQKNQEKKRKEMLIRSYPWFVNEMVLLLGAGMQVRNIFAVLIRETERKISDYRAPLISELEAALHAMELGMSEEQAYYQLGRRLKLPCYIKLMTLLEQNVKRGAKGLSVVFEQEELSALEERKNLAKRYGEEAGTKLLGPMILLLLVVMLMIMIPAFWGIM